MYVAWKQGLALLLAVLFSPTGLGGSSMLQPEGGSRSQRDIAKGYRALANAVTAEFHRSSALCPCFSALGSAFRELWVRCWGSWPMASLQNATDSVRSASFPPLGSALRRLSMRPLPSGISVPAGSLVDSGICSMLRWTLLSVPCCSPAGHAQY